MKFFVCISPVGPNRLLQKKLNVWKENLILCKKVNTLLSQKTRKIKTNINISPKTIKIPKSTVNAHFSFNYQGLIALSKVPSAFNNCMASLCKMGFVFFIFILA